MLRSSQKTDRTRSYQSRQDNLDKRLNLIREQIDDSREKIDQYLDSVGSQLTTAVTKKLNQFVVFHDQIVQSKQRQIQKQRQLNEHYQQTELYQKYAKFEGMIKENQQNMKRFNDILLMFKKQAERYKIQLDITQKELEAAKKRQKQLLKKVWCLEEDIRDIYSYEPSQLPQPDKLLSNRRKVKTDRKRTTNSELINMNQNTSKTIKTHQSQPKDSTKLLIAQKTSMPKPSIYDMTTLSHHLNQQTKPRYRTNQTEMATASARPSFQRNRPASGIVPSSYLANQKKASVYDDLRYGIRKAENIDFDVPAYLEKDRRIGLQQFRLIVLKLPQILKQIEKIPIQEQSFLKQVDSHSIWLLSDLISHPNAVKMLEIVLFNYSLEALRQIKEKKEILTIEQTYQQPILDDSFEEVPASRIGKKNKHKLELSIHKNFKAKMANQRIELFSARKNDMH